jgi:ribonuclease HI
VGGQSIAECMEAWLLNLNRSKRLPLYTIWFIWKERNLALFEGKSPSELAVVLKTNNALRKKRRDNKSQGLRLKTFNRLLDYDLATFDGAAAAGGSRCGAGGTLKCLNSLEYRWYFNCGVGSNTKAELLGAWASLLLANHLGIQQLQVLGDSRVIIDWLRKVGKLQAINIEGWKIRVRELQFAFLNLSFHHIFRESNEEADKLSKRALDSPKGRLTYFLWDGVTEGPLNHWNIF